MKLLGEVGAVVSRVPAVSTQLNRALRYGQGAGLSSVLGFACLAWAVSPLLFSTVLSLTTLVAMTGSLLLLMLAFWLRQQAETLAHRASYQLEVHLRRDMADHLAILPLGRVQSQGSGRIKKVMLDDVKALHIAVADAVPFLGVSLSQPLAALLILMLVQWRLGLAALAILPFSLLCMALMTRDHQGQRERYNQASEAINAGVIELVQGMPVMRTFDNGEAGWLRFTASLQQFTHAVSEWMAVSKTPWKINRILVAALPTVMIISLCGVWMLSQGWITLPQLVLALMIGTLPVQAMEPLMHLTNYLNDANVAARRITAFMAQTPLVESADPQYPQGHELVFDNVSFRYPGQQQWALQAINLRLQAGCQCAIVGASGSGKSTLARLIPRFYDVDHGEIRLGGQDIRHLSSQTLLQQMALVLQEPFLFSATLAENLRLSRPEATDVQLLAAINMAGASEIVALLPEGLQTQIGERGASLSGGQRQRITLARALLSEAPILILDEATSFIDAVNEKAIRQSLVNVSPARTILTIAHRLNGVVDADLILMMHQGEIVEQGTHTQLLAMAGHYARLWHHHQQASNWTLQREITS